MGRRGCRRADDFLFPLNFFELITFFIILAFWHFFDFFYMKLIRKMSISGYISKVCSGCFPTILALYK